VSSLRAAATLAMFLPRRLLIRLRSTEIFVVSGCRWIRGFNRDTNEVLLQQVRVLAEAHDATPGQVALAWLLAQHPWIVPIPGARRAERIAENATATQARAARP